MPKLALSLILYFALFSSVLYAYLLFSAQWVHIANANLKELVKLEIPLLFLGALFLYLPSKNKKLLLAAFSTATIVLLYIIFDLFYSFLMRSVQLSDFANITLIWNFDPLLSLGAFALLLLLLFLLIYPFYIFYQEYTKRSFFLVLALKATLLLGAFFYLQTPSFAKHFNKRFSYFHWSQKVTIQKSGRLASFLYYTSEAFLASKELQNYKNKDLNVTAELFGNFTIENPKNIYIVALESFIDPRLIKDIAFNKDPLSEKLKPYLYQNNFSFVTSPVYGGDTAQAEFEILTGIKAFAKINSIEFNLFEGGHISGFVDFLQRNGYKTYATIAPSPIYFNAKTAYQSIGFDDILYLSYEDEKVFDAELFRHSLEFIKKKKTDQPYLYYNLGMYGHHPYKRDYKKRPNIIEVNHKDKRVTKVTNMFYFRTDSLANYLEDLLAYDASSIILVTSDHLPPLFNKEVFYTKDLHTNIALMLVDGKPQNIEGLHYYEYAVKILSYLRKEKNPTQSPYKGNSPELYYKALSETIR